MKTIKSFFQIIAFITILGNTTQVLATTSLKRLGIVYIDSKGWDKAISVTQIVRLEAGKLNTLDVLNQYDINEVLKSNNVVPEQCLSKDNLISAGKLLKADYMLGGSVERYNDRVLVMFREIEVSTGNTSRMVTKDFPVVDHDIQVLIEVTLKEMYGIAITDPNKLNLDHRDAIANAVNTPDLNMVSVGGPRFGLCGFTGEAANFFTRSTKEGGLNGYPVMFQFGYQFEKMYLNEGNLQALVEFLPMLSGMDQGKMFPSLTLLNGFRSAHSGWEFAFGPTLSWTRVSEGYFINGHWIIKNQYTGAPMESSFRADTRGDIVTKTGLLLAAGKTFKSGKLNMPFNFYIVPRKTNLQIGVSYGFNTMKTREQ